MKATCVYFLNDDWHLIDGNGENLPCYHCQPLPEDALKVNLPTFSFLHLEDHVGISWYEKYFDLAALPCEQEKALLIFGMVDFRAEVSVNGIVVGDHVGGEDSFFFDVTKYLKLGENRIAVRVSKPYAKPVDGYTFGEVPHRNQREAGLTPGSCYNESGMPGEVCLRILPKITLDDLYLVADVDSGEVRAEITVCSDREADATLKMDIRLAPDGEVEDRIELSLHLTPGENMVKAVLAVANHRLWSMDDPVLYGVYAELQTQCGVHTATKRTGFRSFIVGEDGYFYLNGTRIYLRCSHTGNSMPESTHHLAQDKEMLRKDFLLAKSVGFNMIRFIAGAALPIQLDLCDEIGLMIYEEPCSAWAEANGPHAAELYNHDLLTMVKRDRSHPCITIWGLLNEEPSTEPFDQTTVAARDVLPALRDLDETRLVLFNSGRWDHWTDVGSLANPGSREWQKIWGNESVGMAENEDFGDIHHYLQAVPLDQDAINGMRRFGRGMKNPVFVSESGVGSALDTVSLVRWFEQRDTIDIAPDVKMIRQMNDYFLRDIKRFGFEDCVPFPSALMRTSFQNHAYYRTQQFDQLRGNPNICGISLTGLLDHSICGEGLWTLHRKFKPMIADVLQDGFAPLRWCLFLSAPAILPGQPLTVEAILASEDILKPGKEYKVRAGILSDKGPVDIRNYSFTMTEEQVKHMTVDVFTDTWNTGGLRPGEYEFVAELCAGGEASGGVYKFHVCQPAKGEGAVYAAGLTQQEIKTVESLGYTVLPVADYEHGGVILVGVADADLAAQIQPLLQEGAYVVAIHAGQELDRSILMLPEERRPGRLNCTNDWLYHRETVLRSGGRFFGGMRTGLADARLYTGVINGRHMDAEGVQVPDETDAFAFETGFFDEKGYMGGYKLGSFRVGSGELVVNTFTLLEKAATVPYAAQMMVNILNYGLNK